MKRIVALLLAAAMCFSVVGCAVSEEDIKEVVKDQAKEAVGNAVGEAVDNVEDALQEKGEQLQDSIMEQIPEDGSILPSGETASGGESSSGGRLPVTGEPSQEDLSPSPGNSPEASDCICNPGVPELYDEKKNIIVCECGGEYQYLVDYETFKTLVRPPYHFSFTGFAGWIFNWINGISEYEYYSRKYAAYLGKDPIDLELEGKKDECIIHYDAAGGILPPEDQYVSVDEKIKIPVEKPVRVGYHFLGWGWTAQENEEDGEPSFFADTEVPDEMREKFAQDVTLYAQWLSVTKEVPVIYWQYHDYDVDDDRTFVTVRCDCGAVLSDRTLSREAFFKALEGKREYAELDRLYKLYSAQYIGPLAIYFNAELYQKNAPDPNADKKTASLLDVFSAVSDAAKLAKQASKIDAKLAKQILKDKGQSKLAETFFKGVAEKADIVSEDIGAAICAIQVFGTANNLLNPTGDPLEDTKYFLDALECVASFYKVEFIAGVICNTLAEGVDLLQKCRNNVDSYVTALSSVKKRNSPALVKIFCGKDAYLILGNLVLAGGKGCQCGVPGATCPFLDDAKRGPSVAEVLAQLCSCQEPLDNTEKMIVLYYLAERSKHELFQASGITLDEYSQLVEEEFHKS